MNRNKISTTLQSGTTKEAIIRKANELINEMGMVDYRIDYLSEALQISPGNITYHYPKKDDITITIWNNFCEEIKLLADNHITPFIDIKQLYIFIRNVLKTSYNYRGVISYILGDPGVINRDRDTNDLIWSKILELKEYIFSTLKENKYLLSDNGKILEKLCFETQITILLWWANHALINSNNGDIESKIDHYALMSMEPLTILFSTSGEEQFRTVVNSVNR